MAILRNNPNDMTPLRTTAQDFPVQDYNFSIVNDRNEDGQGGFCWPSLSLSFSSVLQFPLLRLQAWFQRVA